MFPVLFYIGRKEQGTYPSVGMLVRRQKEIEWEEER